VINPSKSFQEQSNNEEIIPEYETIKWHSIIEQDIAVNIGMHSNNISLGFEPDLEDAIPNREPQKEIMPTDNSGSSNDLGESGENYMDRSHDSMPDFSHLQ